MLSEFLLILSISFLMLQTSSLLSALTIVPSSLLFIYISSSGNEFSGLLMVLYIMIFIGGLMILLVSLTSLAPQESGHPLSPLLPVLMCSSIPLLLELKASKNSTSLMPLLEWVEKESNLLNLLAITLVIALFIMSNFLQMFKALMRSL